jgi:hypothetical protein
MLYLVKMMKDSTGIAIAVDNCCAVEIIDNSYRIIYSKPGANAYRVYWKENKYYNQKIKKSKKLDHYMNYQNIKRLKLYAPASLSRPEERK